MIRDKINHIPGPQAIPAPAADPLVGRCLHSLVVSVKDGMAMPVRPSAITVPSDLLFDKHLTDSALRTLLVAMTRANGEWKLSEICDVRAMTTTPIHKHKRELRAAGYCRPLGDAIYKFSAERAE